MKQGEHPKRKSGSKNRREIKPQAQQDSDCRRDPDGSGGGQPAYAYSFLENHTRPKESNTCHYPLRHPACVRSNRTDGTSGQPRRLIQGHQHEQAAGQANENMRPETGRVAMYGSFKTNDCASTQCAYQMKGNGRIVNAHAVSGIARIISGLRVFMWLSIRSESQFEPWISI
jgi:hypothetical protein